MVRRGATIRVYTPHTTGYHWVTSPGDPKVLMKPETRTAAYIEILEAVLLLAKF